MEIQFFKYQGAGNDFIVIDNRSSNFDAENVKLISFLCHRRFGVGADGLMLLESAEGFDFKMRYFNSDGKEASMCGNGARCIVAFAKKLSLIDSKALFIASDGEHQAYLLPDGTVNLHMSNVASIKEYVDGFSLNTGVPHFVKFVHDLHVIDIVLEGRQLRYDSRFQPAGTNVNFVHHNGNELTVYTYERGVEDETLACGTGITAASLSAAYIDKKSEGTYFIKAKGGNLEVSFKNQNGNFMDIWLKGPAELVYQGIVSI